jgi:type IV secretory pathway TrbL component
MTYTTLARAPALTLALALAAAAFTLPALPAHADSFASSASSAGSASSGSISDSIGGSSNSSSGDNRRAETGPYRVIDIAQAPAKAGTTRITLRAVAGDAATEFWVDVPDRALAERRVARDEVVQVNERVYGYEFAYGDTKKPFFLALQDDWYRELASRKVTI